MSLHEATLQPYGPQPTRLLCPWDSPSENTGAGCHCLLRVISPTQGWKPCISASAVGFFAASATWEDEVMGRADPTQRVGMLSKPRQLASPSSWPWLFIQR